MSHRLAPLWGPWTFALGNADNPNNGEIRDNRGILLNLRAVMNEQDEAVMRAMAAAPELLEALEAIAKIPGNLPRGRYLTKTGPNDAAYRGQMVVDMRDIARTAIAKARSQ